MLRALRRSLVSSLTVSSLTVSTLAASAVVLAPAPAADAAEGMGLGAATRFTEHDPGNAVDDADVAAALGRIGHDPGNRVDEGDERVLVDWADRAKQVVDTALAQVGDPYRWGADGPGAFDCSGLTLFAWRAAGVDLPHNSRAQARATRGVPRGQMVPGDLVFYGDPIHHVAVYIGDGKVVDSPRSGYDVKVDDRMMQRGDLVKFGRVTP